MPDRVDIPPIRERSSDHPAITPKVLEALMKGGMIASVYSHEGSPGGHNNDRLELTMESGQIVSFDIYSLWPLAVEVVPKRRRDG